MLKGYLKIAFRTLGRHPGYATINVLGLAVGLGCCLLIGLFVRDELSYDRYHERGERVYRITREWFGEDGRTTLHLARVAAPIGPLLEATFPEVEAAARILEGEIALTVGDRHFESDVFYIEPSLFDLFTIPFVDGDPRTALQEPYTLVLTEEKARALFGDGDALGEVVRDADGDAYRVTGIVAPPPGNTHFDYEVLASFATLEAVFSPEQWTTWGWNNYATYLLLGDGADAAALEAKLPGFLEARHETGSSRENRLHLQRLADIHLHSHLDAEFEPNGDVRYLYLFSAIGLAILLIACFNFMNLATARASRRAKEVGMRKVLGAERRQLVLQFQGEAFGLVLIATGTALVLAHLVLPLLNTFTARTLALADVPIGFYAIRL